MTKHYLWHNDVLQKFSEEQFSGTLKENLLTNEIHIDGTFYWLAYLDKRKILVNSELVKQLPIRVMELEKYEKGKEVYNLIKEYKTTRINPFRFFSFRNLVDNFCNFEHTNPRDFLLYKLLVVASYIERINVRICTEASFGKNSLFECLGYMKNNISISNPRTMASIEWRLLNKVIVLDELSNLDTSQIKLVQEFLLRVAGGQNIYERSAMAMSGSKFQNKYDIGKLSMAILYNPVEYYEEVGQADKFFDKIFTHAVHSRFMPFKFRGSIPTAQFSIDKPIDKLVNDNKQFYLQWLKSLEYYFINYEAELKEYAIDISAFKLTGRHPLVFERIAKILNLYSRDRDEYLKLLKDMYERYIDYEQSSKDLSKLTTYQDLNNITEDVN